jgi:mRNA-degrading endonuclease RelE of RelBE toxin-antitoxin system
MSAMTTILWERKAIRQLKKVREEDRRQITASVQSLSDWPDCRNVKAMINHKYQYRLRVGRYRVFFNMEISLHILKIEEVKKRDESTY